MRWRTTAVTIAAAVLGVAGWTVVGAGADALTDGTPHSAVATTGFPTGGRNPGIFTDRCAYSHSLADDPIMAPGRAGASMRHDFYGNRSTSAESTAASLSGRTTTCSTAADASAYWVPVLYQRGTPLVARSALIYWRRPSGDADAVRTIPAGLQMIAGNESATAPQPMTVTTWTCQGVRGHRSASPHDCPTGSALKLVVTFPSCWDGHTLAGAMQTNVVYRSSQGCPASHPVQIPQIVFHVSYPTGSASALTLSTGPHAQGSVDTAHADFIDGWTQDVVDADVAACVATSTRCGPVSGAQATPSGPAQRRMQARRMGKRHR